MSEIHPPSTRNLTLSIEQLTVLVESIRTITSNLHIDEVLMKILSNALTVIPEADAGYLMLFDEERQVLTPMSFVNFPQSIQHFQTKPGESITGNVFMTGIGRFYNSYDEILLAMKENHVSESNFQTILISARQPQAAICVPITLNNKAIGVMIIHQLQKKRDLNSQDLLFFQAYADQVGIAIHNAQHYDNMRQKMNEISSLSEALSTQHYLLQQRYNVHTILNKLLLENQPITVMLREIHLLIQMPISFYDSYEDLFHHESHELPSYTMNKIKSQLHKKTLPFIYRMKNKRHCYVYPLYHLELCIGGLIIEYPETIPLAHQQTIEQGANILILQIMRNKNINELYNKRLADYFQQLLTSTNEKKILDITNTLDLKKDHYYLMCLLELKPDSDIFFTEKTLHQLLTMLQKHFAGERKILYCDQGKIRLLLGLGHSLGRQSLLDQLQSFQDKWLALGKPAFRCGLSKPYQSIRSLPRLYEEAQQTLLYLQARNRWDIASFEKIGLNHLILHVPPSEVQSFVQQQLGPLFEQKMKNELYATLKAYFHFNRSAKQTASYLHIHSNTLYQRLARVEQLLEISLLSHDDCLNLQLACHLKEHYLSE